MNNSTRRVIARCLHIVCGIPIIGYIYSPFDSIPDYAPATRFVFLPLMVLSGLWMWKGQTLRKAIANRTSNRGEIRGIR